MSIELVSGSEGSTEDREYIEARLCHKAYVYALRVLTGREYSGSQLNSKLSERFDLSVEQIKRLLQRLEAEGYLSDERFAESQIRQLLRRHYGPAYIFQSLKQNGVDTAIVSALLSDDKSYWVERAHSAISYFSRTKWFGSTTKAKISSMLSRKGFGVEVIYSVVNQYK